MYIFGAIFSQVSQDDIHIKKVALFLYENASKILQNKVLENSFAKKTEGVMHTVVKRERWEYSLSS